MGRSIKKGPFIDGHLLEKIVKAKADFMQLWSGQAGLRAETAPSAQIFRRICGEALALLA